MTADGLRDLRYPQLTTRTTVGWEGPVLAGRALAGSNLSFNLLTPTVQRSGQYETVSETDTSSVSMYGSKEIQIPAHIQLNWENRFQIKSFSLFWRLENLLDFREMPAPGWTPPGIRSGWGITWNFGG